MHLERATIKHDATDNQDTARPADVCDDDRRCLGATTHVLRCPRQQHWRLDRGQSRHGHQHRQPWPTISREWRSGDVTTIYDVSGRSALTSLGGTAMPALERLRMM